METGGGCQSSSTSTTDTVECETRPCPTTLYGSLGVLPSCSGPIAAVGQLTSVHVSLEQTLSVPYTWMITAQAQCMGSSVRSRDPSWRGRHVEVARLLMRELLSSLRSAINAVSTTNSYSPVPKFSLISNSTDSESNEYASLHSLEGAVVDDTGESSNTPILSYTPPLVENSDCDEVPGVRVVDVDWGSNIRWGGDAHYDPRTDGYITLHGACTLPDPYGGEPRLMLDENYVLDFVSTLAARLSTTRTVEMNTWAPVSNMHHGCVFGSDELQCAGFKHVLGWTAPSVTVRLYGGV